MYLLLSARLAPLNRTHGLCVTAYTNKVFHHLLSSPSVLRALSPRRACRSSPASLCRSYQRLHTAHFYCTLPIARNHALPTAAFCGSRQGVEMGVCSPGPPAVLAAAGPRTTETSTPRLTRRRRRPVLCPSRMPSSPTTGAVSPPHPVFVPATSLSSVPHRARKLLVAPIHCSSIHLTAPLGP